MTEAEAKRRIDELTEKLNFHSYQYYVLNDSDLSDYDYDRLQRELLGLETAYPALKRPDSPTSRVGGQAQSLFTPVRHDVRMESLQDAFSYDEIDDFDRRVRESFPDATYVVEPKIDGLSVSLEYENGVFTRGSTRGDGDVGAQHYESQQKRYKSQQFFHILFLPENKRYRRRRLTTPEVE